MTHLHGRGFGRVAKALAMARKRNRARVLLITPVVAAAALASLALPAGGSNDPCTVQLGGTGTVQGGPGRDVLCGSPENDTLRGGDGNDELRGRGGNDDLEGEADNDELFGGFGEDDMFGGGSADELRGGSGRDELFGGAGGDELRGQGSGDELFGGSGGDTLEGGTGGDSLRGETGNDSLNLGDDGELDLVPPFCGDGIDRLHLDLVDAGFHLGSLGIGLILSGCESITAAAVNEGPNVRVRTNRSRLRSRRRVRVRMRCPASLRRDCEGRASIRLVKRSCRSRSPRRTEYDINPGDSERVTLRVSRRERRCIRRKRRLAIVRAVEQGDHGPKTTIKRITVLRPR